MFTNNNPRLRTRLRSLTRQRAQVERLLDSVQHDHDLQRTHADSLAQLDILDEEIHELTHLLFLASTEKALIWLLPALTATVSLLLATLG